MVTGYELLQPPPPSYASPGFTLQGNSGCPRVPLLHPSCDIQPLALATPRNPSSSAPKGEACHSLTLNYHSGDAQHL